MATSLKEHLELAEHNLLCAKQLAFAEGHRDLAREIERIYREVIVGVEDIYYRATNSRVRDYSQSTRR